MKLKKRRLGGTAYNTTDVIHRVIKFFGSQRAWAESLGAAEPSVHRWVKQGYVPARWVLTIEKITKGKVSRYQLRPDLYGREE